MSLSPTFVRVGAVFLILVLSPSCGWLTRSAKHEEENTENSDQYSATEDGLQDIPVKRPDPHVEIQGLKNEIQQLRTKVSELESAQVKTETDQGKYKFVEAPIAALAGTPAAPEKLKPTEKSPLTQNLSNDPAIQMFREAMTRFEGNQNLNAAIGFTEFLKEYPDHALAGAAQFHIGESYFKRNEYKKAVEEFQRVLVSYDRSSYVPEALARLVTIQEMMNLDKKADENRHMLALLYPTSAANLGLKKKKRIEKNTTSAPRHEKAPPPPSEPAAPPSEPAHVEEEVKSSSPHLDEPPMQEPKLEDVEE